MTIRGTSVRTDGSLSAGSTVHGRDLQQTVGINLKRGDKLGLATGHRRDTGELELSEQPVVPTLRTLALVYGERNSCLVILDGGECPTFVGRDGSVARDNDAEDIALHGNTEREWGNVEKKQVGSLVRGLAGEDGSLNGSTVGDGLVGVDRLVQLAAIEELANQGLDLWNPCRAPDKNDIIHLNCIEAADVSKDGGFS
jgi:hypothetical protein